jgi:hypothetical protein
VLDQTREFSVLPGFEFIGEEHRQELGQGELALFGLLKSQIQMIFPV